MAVTDNWIPQLRFRTRLQLARKHLGLSQADAAERCGIDKETWGKWERGIHTPHDMAAVAEKINAGLGVNPSWLLFGEQGCLTGDESVLTGERFLAGIAA